MKKILPSAVFLLTVSSFANAQTYTFKDLGQLGAAYSSYATAINNAGQVTGGSTQYQRYRSFSRATTWDGTVVNVLSPLVEPNSDSYALAINNFGQVAGASSGYYANATVWSGANATTLSTPTGGGSVATGINDAGIVAGYSGSGRGFGVALWNGNTGASLGGIAGLGGSSMATGINNSSQVAGWSYTTGDAAVHAVMWDGDKITDLGALNGFAYSQANAINNAGQLAGMAMSIGGLEHAILWNGTKATDLGTPDGANSVAIAINNAGKVVGITMPNPAGYGNQQATLWTGTSVIDLNTLLSESVLSAGWVLQSANGINDHDSIVGSAYNTQTHSYSAFLLTLSAVPEPETYAMLLAGLGLLGFMRHRNNLSKLSII